MSGPQRIVLGAWLAMIGLATAKSLTEKRGLPQPGVFLFSAILFSGYYVAAGIAALGTLVAVFAVGTDVAIVAYPYLQGRASFLDKLNTSLVGQLPAGTLPPGHSGP